MGVHHFSLHLIPTDVSANSYDNGFLHEHSVSDAILLRLRGLLPKDTSWGTTEEFRSDADWPSDLRIWKEEDGTIFDIVFRYSPVTDPKELLFSFLSIAKDADFLIYEKSSKSIFRPEEAVITKLFLGSASHRFLTDPETTILEAAAKTKSS